MKNGLMINGFGDKFWYRDDLLHRLDGPAIEYNSGYKAWYKEGKRHRLDGPAIEWDKMKHWYYEGKRIYCSSTKEFLQIIKLRAFR